MKGREHEPKITYFLHATRVKHPSERIAESDKHEGNRNGVKARKERIQMEVENIQRAQAPPTCTQPIHRRWATSQGYQRVWSSGREKEVVYFWVPAQTSLGEMSC